MGPLRANGIAISPAQRAGLIVGPVTMTFPITGSSVLEFVRWFQYEWPRIQ